MKVDMIASRNMRYKTRRMKAGESFQALSPRDARLLEAIKWAKPAEVVPAPASAPAPAPAPAPADNLPPASTTPANDPVDELPEEETTTSRRSTRRTRGRRTSSDESND